MLRVADSTRMLIERKRKPDHRSLHEWALAVLSEAGAIRKCEYHGWMQDRADPHASERALEIARRDRPRGVAIDEAVAAVEDVLSTVGDTCPECLEDLA
jgi:LmbE family N-acetylglucosaminyl deacetylase